MQQNLIFYLTVIWAINIYASNGYDFAMHRRHSIDQVKEVASIDSDTIIEGTKGKRISMKCTVNNLKNYKITWYFKGIALTYNNIRIRNDKRISIENPKPNEWILIIDGIDSKDEGYYSCRLDNGLKKFMHLIIGVPPKFIGSHNGNHVIVNTVVGENVTLSCEAYGNPAPTIYWYRHNKLVSTGAHLHILNVSRFAHSEYECVARNKVDPAASRRFRINVNFPPVLNIMYNLMFQTVRGELQVLCEISANPINSVRWYRNNEELKDASANQVIMLHNRNSVEIKKEKPISIHTKRVAQHKFVSKLRLLDVSPASNGIYKCVVNGFEGKDVSKEVLVTEIKDTPKQEKLTSKVASFNKELTFQESAYLGRGARSNITKVGIESFTLSENLSSSASKASNIVSFGFICTYLILNNYIVYS